MKKIEAIIRPFKLEEVKQSLSAIGVVGITVSEVRGTGGQPSARVETYRGLEYGVDLNPGVKLEVVVPGARADQVVSFIARAARTGHPGAGTIFVSPLDDAIRITNGRARRGHRINRPPEAARRGSQSDPERYRSGSSSL